MIKLTIWLDGHFSGEEHQELNELYSDISIDWNMNIFPMTGDYFNLDFFIKLPDFAKGQLWSVINREFIDDKTIMIGLMCGLDKT